MTKVQEGRDYLVVFHKGPFFNIIKIHFLNCKDQLIGLFHLDDLK
jgi:hypothetical protein